MSNYSGLTVRVQRARKTRRHSLFVWVALPLLAFIGTTAQATPFYIKTFGETFIDVGAGSTFNFSVSTGGINFTGQSQLTVSVLGVYADGGRDGASITPIGSSLVTTSITSGGTGSVGVGGAAKFEGDNGTAGEILIAPINGTDFGAPTRFTNTSSQVFLPIGGASTPLHTAIGGGVVDGGVDGASLTGLFPGDSLGKADVGIDGGTLSFGLGSATVDQSSSFVDSDTHNVPCNTQASLAACDVLTLNTDFMGSGGGDFFALLGRLELGGRPITGKVLSDYGLETVSGIVNCTSGFCNLQTNLDFNFSGRGDTAVFAIRVELDQVPMVPVPLPSSLLLLSAGIVGLIGWRRRN
jgi:hypothetical protein